MAEVVPLTRTAAEWEQCAAEIFETMGMRLDSPGTREANEQLRDEFLTLCQTGDHHE